MRASLCRRQFLELSAAGLSTALVSELARAQSVTPSPRKVAAADEHFVSAPAVIDVKARPIPSFDPRDRSHVRFGALEFRSGLVLTSSFPSFGGLSAIRLDAKGERFTALSDRGTWFTGRIVYADRAMTGLEKVEAAPMLGPDGRPLTTRGWFDTESLAFDGSFAYVGIERVNQLLRFDFSQGGTRTHGEVVQLPAAAKKLPRNKGLEALVFVPKGFPLAGTLLAMSERGLDPDGNLIAFLVGGPSPGQFGIRRSEDFDISDAVLLASGDLLVLERKFSLFAGVGIRIRRIPLATITPGALVDGPAIFNADLGQEIDNFEGLDAHVTEQGEIVLTIVSDDNFSLIQRTLLMQFTLVA